MDLANQRFKEKVLVFVSEKFKNPDDVIVSFIIWVYLFFVESGRNGHAFETKVPGTPKKTRTRLIEASQMAFRPYLC